MKTPRWRRWLRKLAAAGQIECDCCGAVATRRRLRPVAMINEQGYDRIACQAKGCAETGGHGLNWKPKNPS